MILHSEALPRLEGIPIAYEDRHILVVAKPAGVPVQQGDRKRPCLTECLMEGIRKRDKKPGRVYLAPLHRLDQAVPGLLLYAKTSKAASRLSEALRRRAWGRIYLAVLDGRPPAAEACLRDRLIKDPRSFSSRIWTPSDPPSAGKEASLRYHCLGFSPDGQRSLVAVKLETGRAHQIRVQFASRGLPVVADYRYNPRWKQAPAGDEIALFAAFLYVEHPVRKEGIQILLRPSAPFFTRDYAERLDRLNEASLLKIFPTLPVC